MRRLIARAQSSVSRTNALTVTLSVVLGAVAVYGFANQVVQERDAAITRAVQQERTQREALWGEFRDELRDVKVELHGIRQGLADLRVQVTAIGALRVQQTRAAR